MAGANSSTAPEIMIDPNNEETDRIGDDSIIVEMASALNVLLTIIPSIVVLTCPMMEVKIAAIK
jgi:hypothetical protein